MRARRAVHIVMSVLLSLGTLIALIAAIVSRRTETEIVRWEGDWGTWPSQSVRASLSDGRLEIVWLRLCDPMPTSKTELDVILLVWRHYVGSEYAYHSWLAAQAVAVFGTESIELIIRLWCILPLLAAYPIIALAVYWFRSGRTGAPNGCRACGYDLRATTEPRCPECGTPFDPSLLRDGSGSQSRSPGDAKPLADPHQGDPS